MQQPKCQQAQDEKMKSLTQYFRLLPLSPVHPVFHSRSPIVISCSPHITPYLKKELTASGFPVLNETFTTIQTEGNFDDAIKLNLSLRTANHVFLLIRKFIAPSIQKLYEEVKTVDWEELIPADGYFSVHSVAEHPEVTNFMFLNMKIKDAIADRFMEKTNQRPDSGAEKIRTVVFLHWKDNEASLYLDTSGESLTRHGYRKIASKAPMQESLAAALILSTPWDRKSPFVNPMCGSGTLAIEAALMASNKPPGLIRKNFGFMHLNGFDKKKYDEQLAALELNVDRAPKTEIIASDRDRRALGAAQQNAKLAGVDHLIRFVTCEFDQTPVPEEKGVIIFNPPYGERLGATDELRSLYSSIGNFLKHKTPGYLGYVFTASQELSKYIGLKPKSKRNFLNGSLECRLLEFEIFAGKRKDHKREGN
jgi:putative N6-adenine-specific DNA methylase